MTVLSSVLDAPVEAAAGREQLLELVHELRKPLQGIEAFAHLLHGEIRDERLREYAEIVLTGAQDLSATFDRLVDFAGPSKLLRETVDLEKAFRSVARLVVGGSPRVRVACACDDDAGAVAADLQAIRQVFFNLISNAAEAMEGPGEIRLVTQREGRFVVLSVSDTGRGMDPEGVLRAPEPFYTTRRQGMGLGLSVVRKIARAHGGDLTITSRPGEGATCRVTIEDPGA